MNTEFATTRSEEFIYYNYLVTLDQPWKSGFFVITRYLQVYRTVNTFMFVIMF